MTKIAFHLEASFKFDFGHAHNSKFKHNLEKKRTVTSTTFFSFVLVLSAADLVFSGFASRLIDS